MKSKPTRLLVYSRIIEFLFCNGTEIRPGMMQAGEVSKESQAVEDFGGPCRGRTYGPLIKSDNRPFLTTLAIATVSPILLQYRCPGAYFLFYVNPFYPFRSDRVWSQKWSHLLLSRAEQAGVRVSMLLRWLTWS
jgi:hypothetical protein